MKNNTENLSIFKHQHNLFLKFHNNSDILIKHLLNDKEKGQTALTVNMMASYNPEIYNMYKQSVKLAEKILSMIQHTVSKT